MDINKQIKQEAVSHRVFETWNSDATIVINRKPPKIESFRLLPSDFRICGAISHFINY